MYRAFWLDTETGRHIRLRRGGDVEKHVEYVVEHPDTFGFSGPYAGIVDSLLQQEQLPYEVSEYPEPFVTHLLGRWIKVNVDGRFVSFTTTDRLSSRHIEAMQDFLVDARLMRLGVFIAGEPSGQTIALFQESADFYDVVAIPAPHGGRHEENAVYSRPGVAAF